MNKLVDAVFFDMGGTLRYRVKDPDMRLEALSELKRVLSYAGNIEDLFALLKDHASAYKDWSQDTLREAPEEEIWTKWMWPEGDSERISDLAIRLEHLWRATQGKRIARSDAHDVVDALSQRGYRLGIISNTTSREAVPKALVEYNLDAYFPVVILSASSGHRKPGTMIFEIATSQLRVSPDRCAYVGDRPSRDVLGSKRAGFAMSVLIYDDLVEVKEPVDEYPAPDYTIQSLTELLDIL
jgi:putative hydrolase of the HAD superfamily